MAYRSDAVTGIYGRRLGLQTLSTNKTGGSRGPTEYLVGPEAVREGVSTEIPTTNAGAVNLHPFGFSLLTTAASSGIFIIDPPVPGVEKTVVFATSGTNPIYLRTANAETFNSSQGTSHTTLTSSQGAYISVKLVGISTAAYAILTALSSLSLRASTST
jgi:hypothetical protein